MDAKAALATAESVETISHEGRIVCVLVRSQPMPEVTHFYTAPDLPMQFGKIVYPAGSRIARHSHRKVTRSFSETTEVLVVQKGRIVVDVYSDDRTFLCSRELEAGDVIVQITGGHGFEFAEDTVLLEIKQGPYLGDQEKVPF